MIYVELLISVRFWLIFRVSRKFPEITWRAVHSRQAAHAFVHVLCSWKRNCLAAHYRPPGDAWRLTQFWVWWMKRLAVLIEPLGGAGQIDLFLVFLWSGLF